jgi:cell division protein FtsX
MRFLPLVVKNLGRNPARTAATGLAMVVLVVVVILIGAVFFSLDQLLSEKARDFKMVVRLRWRMPSPLPLSYLAPSAAAPPRGRVTLSRPVQEGGPGAMPEADYYAGMSELNRQFLTASALVAGFLALAGACSLMNTMFAAVHQRRREIGVLRVLGYRRGQIVASFLLESLVIALAGGVVGCALGFAANGLTASSTVYGNQGIGKDVVLRLVVDGGTVAVGLAYTVALGGLGGLLPALAATRVRPLESLVR